MQNSNRFGDWFWKPTWSFFVATSPSLSTLVSIPADWQGLRIDEWFVGQKSTECDIDASVTQLLSMVPLDLVLTRLVADGEVLRSRLGTWIPLSAEAKPCSHCLKQKLQILTLSKSSLEVLGSLGCCAGTQFEVHLAQKTRPQCRQWCLRLIKVNWTSHS